jgi:hypothetical protein
MLLQGDIEDGANDRLAAMPSPAHNTLENFKQPLAGRREIA